MLVKQEQVTPCEVELHIEVEKEKVDSAIDSAYVDLAKMANIPGFRKGKAPRAILERYLDEEKVKERAADKLLQDAYLDALKESELEPFALADVSVVKLEKGEPMVFTAKVPLAPKVELGDYVGLEAERTVPPVEDTDVDGRIQKMLEEHTSFTEVTDRAVQEADTVVVEMKREDEEDEPKRNVVQVGDNLPDFDKGLLGMNIDEDKVIPISYPEDFGAEELRGKTVPFWVKVIEIHSKSLPELTDDFVKKTFVRETEEGAEPDPDAVDTVEKLRGKIKEAMEKAAQDIAEADVRNKIISQVVEKSTIDYPDVMLQESINERIDDLLQELNKRKVTIDDYLKYTNKSFDDLRSEYEKEAQETLKTSLALREVIEKEDLKVADEDVDADIEAMAGERGVPVETIKAYIDNTDKGQSIRNKLLHKKVVDFLVGASNIKNVGQ